MSSIIYIDDRIDESMVDSVKSSLKAVPENEKEIVFEINSQGGNLEALRKIKGFMYFMFKIKKCKIVGRLIYGESAALLLFLNCEERQVTAESTGVIHLAVLNRPGRTSELQRKREEDALFIMRRSQKMKWQQVFDLENKRLDADALIELGIANKKVEVFTLT